MNKDLAEKLPQIIEAEKHSPVSYDQLINNINLHQVKILLIDKDLAVLETLSKIFQKCNATVFQATNIKQAEKILSKERIVILIGELILDNASILTVFPQFQINNPEGMFCLMTDQANIHTAVQSVKLGVYDFFEKPIDFEIVLNSVNNFAKSFFLEEKKLDPIVEKLRPFLIFKSEKMKRGLSVLPEIAKSNQTVLITGESGTGKEMVARAIHNLSPNSSGPFIAVNCGAIPETLIESELFGYEKGAFTGAQNMRRGKFELAQNGTLFLDELGTMPLHLQVRLLRVLEERQIYRVGGERPIPVNIRLVGATRTELEQAVKDGLFREDLYYRLNVLRIHLPALKERKEDIPLLAWHFLKRAFKEIERPEPHPYFSPETLRLLEEQPWRGNVRELRNIMTRIAVLLPKKIGIILPAHVLSFLPEPIGQKSEIKNNSDLKSDGLHFGETIQPSETQKKLISDQRENHVSQTQGDGVFLPVGTTIEDGNNQLIEATLEKFDYNRTKAAKVLGIGLRTLRRKLNTPKHEV